jgi:hypothetical protein
VVGSLGEVGKPVGQEDTLEEAGTAEESTGLARHRKTQRASPASLVGCRVHRTVVAVDILGPEDTRPRPREAAERCQEVAGSLVPVDSLMGRREAGDTRPPRCQEAGSQHSCPYQVEDTLQVEDTTRLLEVVAGDTAAGTRQAAG